MAAQPQTFPGLNQAILPEFDHEMANTRKSLERVPENKLNFKPHTKSMSLGALATHLATINHWTEAIMGTDSFDLRTAPTTPERKSRAEMLEAFGKQTVTARNADARSSVLKHATPWS